VPPFDRNSGRPACFTVFRWEREAGDLNELGYSSTELDLRDYWGASPTALRTTLSRKVGGREAGSR
jgi:hypothetical protein